MNILGLALLAGLGGGCQTIQDHSLTYALWTDSRDTSHSRPAADPATKLFDLAFPPDTLVEYDAVSDRCKGTRRRAYFLKAGSKRIAAGKPPHFVDARREVGLAVIPVLKSMPPTNSPAFTNGVFAVCKDSAFTLFRPESSPESGVLPYYQDGIIVGSWKRVALTPFALAVDGVVDVTVIGAAAGVVAVCAMCQDTSGWRP